MKRGLLLLFAVSAALPLFAFTTTAASSASQNTGTLRAVMEPVISVVEINGVTHGAAAYMNFPDAVGNPSHSQIQVAHTTDFVNWSAPVTLPLTATNGITYGHSADPVFVEGNGWPYQNWIFCFGTLWTNTNWHGRSTIGVWYSTDGGASWSAPEALDAPPYDPSCEAAGTCIFDDKPMATIGPAPNISGTVYVAWTRTTASTTAIYMSMLIPTRGWAALGQVGESNMPSLPGPTPVVDPTTGKVYLFVMNRPNETIRVFSSNDTGWSWSELAATVSAPGIAMQSFNLEYPNRQQVGIRAVPFLEVKFDALYHHILVLYHRAEGDGVSVVYRRFVPPSLAWTQPQPISANGHRQWNPSMEQMANGHLVFTYYDHNPGESGYSLYASRIDIYGITVETTRIFAAELSNPLNYNLDGTGVVRIGEYQGLAYLNNVLYAATIYVPQSTPRVGNAWVVRFVTP